MTRRQVTHRATCAEPSCSESASWTYDNQADRRDHLKRLRESPYRCVRHSQPSELLSTGQPERGCVLTATRLSHLPDHLFWIAGGKKSGSGFTFGPGFKAFAGDFPEGTRLIVTARVEMPEEAAR